MENNRHQRQHYGTRHRRSQSRGSRNRAYSGGGKAAGSEEALSCFMVFSTEGQEFYEMCSSYSNLAEKYCAIDYSQFEITLTNEGLTCSDGHSLCGSCAVRHVDDQTSEDVDSLALSRRKGMVYCPLHKLNMINGDTVTYSCNSKPYSLDQIKRAVQDYGDEAYERAIECMQRFKELKKFEKKMEALVSISKKHPSVERFILMQTLAKTIKDPRECKVCSFGPVDHKACENYQSHEGQILGTTADGKTIRISNRCPVCGWFGLSRQDWPKWKAEVNFSDLSNPVFIIDALLKRFHFRNISMENIGLSLFPQNVRNRCDYYWSNLSGNQQDSCILGAFFSCLVILQAIGINILGFYACCTFFLGLGLDFLTSNIAVACASLSLLILDYYQYSLRSEGRNHHRNGEFLHIPIQVARLNFLLLVTAVIRLFFDIVKWGGLFHFYIFAIFRWPIDTVASIFAFISITPLKWLLVGTIKLLFRMFLDAVISICFSCICFMLVLEVEKEYSKAAYEEYMKVTKDIDLSLDLDLNDVGDDATKASYGENVNGVVRRFDLNLVFSDAEDDNNA